MNLSPSLELLNLSGERVLSFTGSGGKTSLMYQLSRELSLAGKRTITTTTTHIALPSKKESPLWMLLKDNQDACRTYWEKRPEAGLQLTLGWERAPGGGKLKGLPPEIIPSLCCWKALDTLLIEADGSRGKSLKGYKEHEPVLPPGECCTIIVIGMDIVNTPLGPGTVHRPEILEQMLSVARDELIRVEHLVTLLLHRQGYLARAGRGKKILIFNKIKTEEQYESAKNLYGRISDQGTGVFFRGPRFGTDRETGWFNLVNPESGA
jgi:probable selenium-dependent hydroxylase accessory protein YqeC